MSAFIPVVNRQDEVDMLKKNFNGSGVVPPIDPLNSADVNMFGRVYTNARHIMTGFAKQSLDDEKFNGIMNLLREGNIIDFEVSSEHRQLLKDVFRVMESRHSTNGYKTCGSLLQTFGSALYAIPGINALWGTAAYGIGSALSWYGDQADVSTRSALSHLRYSFLDNSPDNMKDSGCSSLIKKYSDLDSKMERFQDWMIEQDQRMAVVETTLSNMNNGRHCLQFWELFDGMGVVLYLGLDGGTVLVARIASSGYVKYVDSGRMEAMGHHLVSKTLSASDVVHGGNSPKLVSEMSLFAPDDIVRQRFDSMGRVFASTRLNDVELRTAVLLYLQMGL